MAAKLTGLTHRIAIPLHLVSESCTFCSFRLHAASPETFGYTLILITGTTKHSVQLCVLEREIW
jgi:hypothetical protein